MALKTGQLEFWIGLVASVIALVTAVLSLSIVLEQGKQLEEVQPCQKTTIQITKPIDSIQVPVEGIVIGKATIHDICRHVFLFVERIVPDKRSWTVTDYVQVQGNGLWSAHYDIEYIDPGEFIRIEARLTSNPGDYALIEYLGEPPNQGVRSTPVGVRRKQ